MSTSYSPIFEPLDTRGLALKNRVVYPPMATNYDIRTPRAQAYYAERARGGAGFVIVESTRVDNFADEAYVDAIRPLAAAVHAAGAKVALQLAAVPVGMDGAAIAPSATPSARAGTVEEIRWIHAKFARAADGAKRAGFDAVELHGAHGYFFSQFYSPSANRREDAYGGSREARMSFALEAVRAVREAVGAAYTLMYRMNAVELDPGGVTLEDGAALASALELAGVDIIDVSASGGLRRSDPNGAPETDPVAKFPEYAAAVRPHVRIPVIAVGRIHEPATAAGILAAGQADLVAIGRQMLADPFWARKVAEDRENEIVHCDSCNACHVDLARGVPIRCKVNRHAGQEYLG